MREFHTWVADMAGSIEDTSDIKTTNNVNSQPPVKAMVVNDYLKQWYDRAIAEWYRAYSEPPKNDREYAEFMQMYSKQIFNLSYIHHSSNFLPQKMVSILANLFGTI